MTDRERRSIDLGRFRATISSVTQTSAPPRTAISGPAGGLPDRPECAPQEITLTLELTLSFQLNFIRFGDFWHAVNMCISWCRRLLVFSGSKWRQTAVLSNFVLDRLVFKISTLFGREKNITTSFSYPVVMFAPLCLLSTIYSSPLSRHSTNNEPHKDSRERSLFFFLEEKLWVSQP